MNGGPSGFQNAPVTRAVVLVSSVLTIVFAVRGRSNRLGLSYQDIVNGLPIWRIFASVFAFSSTPELMFGIYLLYYFRVFERQIGSNKYSVFILFSVTLSALFETLALMLIKDSNLSTLASGPYALIFASFVPFYFDIPVTSLFRVLGLNFSNKSFIYVAGLQLLLSSWRRSLLPGICGLLVGLLYRLNLFGIRRIKFPKAVESFFSRFFSSSSPSSSHMTSRGSITRNIFPNASRPAQVQQNYPATARAPAPAPEPPESSIAMLVSMGFDSNSARQALMRARNDINMATNILLESQSR